MLVEKGHYKNLPPVSEYMSWLCFGQLRLPTLISCPDCKVEKKDSFSLLFCGSAVILLFLGQSMA